MEIYIAPDFCFDTDTKCFTTYTGIAVVKQIAGEHHEDYTEYVDYLLEYFGVESRENDEWTEKYNKEREESIKELENLLGIK